MERRNYEIPTMKVVQLKHRGILMTSGVSVSLQGAGVNESDADDNGTNIW